MRARPDTQPGAKHKDRIMKSLSRLFHLLLMLLLGVVGLCLAGAAVYGALHNIPDWYGRKLWTGLGVLAVFCWIGVKKLYDDLND